jgi:predicted NBD/HSP70 family sugar kinase
LQALASGPAIANRAREQLRSARESLLLTKVDGHPERITAETVFMAAEQGDPLAQDVVANTATVLGIALANLINLFNPEQIILGGPVGQSSQVLLEPLRAEVQRRAMAYPLSVAQIEISTLGNDADAIGAAVLVLQQASELFFAQSNA